MCVSPNSSLTIELFMRKRRVHEMPAAYFYIENGLMIFTAAFHLKRGYCCKSGCRHCPYGYRKEDNGKLERR